MCDVIMAPWIHMFWHADRCGLAICYYKHRMSALLPAASSQDKYCVKWQSHDVVRKTGVRYETP
jgi:hypothetical protein